MSRGERLLELVVEYQDAKRSRDPHASELGMIGEAAGREPSEIAADYEAELRALLG